MPGTSQNNADSKHLPIWNTGLSAVLATVINFPFEGMKKRLQSNQTLSFKEIMTGIPKGVSVKWNAVSLKQLPELYRGCTAFGVSLVPTSIIQRSMNKRLLEKFGEGTTTKVYSGLFSGAMGAVASTAVENVILTQQKYTAGPRVAVNIIYKKGGITGIWTGFSMISVREAVFASSYLYAAEAAATYYSNVFGTDKTLPAKLGVGVVGALITHPADTIATTMQNSHKKISALKAAKEIYRGKNFESAGAKNFWKGGSWRCALFTGSMLTLEQAPTAIAHVSDEVRDRIHAYATSAAKSPDEEPEENHQSSENGL